MDVERYCREVWPKSRLHQSHPYRIDLLEIRNIHFMQVLKNQRRDHLLCGLSFGGSAVLGFMNLVIVYWVIAMCNRKLRTYIINIQKFPYIIRGILFVRKGI